MTTVTTDPSTTDVQIPMETLASSSTSTSTHSEPQRRLLNDTKEARDDYIKVAVPLHIHALKGNWKEAKSMLEKDETLAKTAITKGWATPLHVAAGANRVHFVEQLVNSEFMKKEDLELKDSNGNTAFFLAAGVGNPQLAKIMINKNPLLPRIRGKNRVTPIQFSVIQGRTEMARFLYHETTTTQDFQENDKITLFLTCINTGIYDLALDMLESNKEILAVARDEQNNTGLHLLARKQPMKSSLKQTQDFRQLVSRLWTIILTTVNSESELHTTIRNPSPLVLDAALAGNFEFLSKIMSSYPDLIWERDSHNRTIIHIAVLQRHARIFNLIHEMGSIKGFIVTLVDDHDKNNLLHLAAKLAPPDQLNLVSGAAFQLMNELLWFEEVKKLMRPFDIEARNNEGKTPSQLFSEEHKKLLEKAEHWMKSTANNCMLVSTVIATGVFLLHSAYQGVMMKTQKLPII